MNELYQKSELGFSIFWIIIYIVVSDIWLSRQPCGSARICRAAGMVSRERDTFL